MGFIAGEAEGAKLVTGGGKPADNALHRGLFIAPTVFDGVTPQMRIGREEIFGPVMSVIPWKDMRRCSKGERARIRADCRDRHQRLAKAMETAERIEAGYVWINSNGRYLGAPYGGWKQSGIGQEECFDELISYTQVKNINGRW